MRDLPTLASTLASLNVVISSFSEARVPFIFQLPPTKNLLRPAVVGEVLFRGKTRLVGRVQGSTSGHSPTNTSHLGGRFSGRGGRSGGRKGRRAGRGVWRVGFYKFAVCATHRLVAADTWQSPVCEGRKSDVVWRCGDKRLLQARVLPQLARTRTERRPAMAGQCRKVLDSCTAPCFPFTAGWHKSIMVHAGHKPVSILDPNFLPPTGNQWPRLPQPRLSLYLRWTCIGRASHANKSH